MKILEKDVEYELYKWLNNSVCVKKVFFNRKNDYGITDIFHTKGKNDKPDLLVLINRGYGEEE